MQTSNVSATFLLLQAGADLEIRNDNGKTALEEAEENALEPPPIRVEDEHRNIVADGPALNVEACQIVVRAMRLAVAGEMDGERLQQELAGVPEAVLCKMWTSTPHHNVLLQVVMPP